MQKYFDSVFGDALGLRPIAGASVTVRMPNGSLASIFSDNGITPKANPVVTDSTGYFDFYAADGKYNLTITAAGFATQIRNDVILEDPAEASPGTFTTLAVTSNSALGGPSSTTTIGGAGVVTNGLSVLSGEFSVNGTGVISASSTGTALRITQTGTGEALRVEDEANPDASPFVIDAAGNVGVGTATPGAKLDVSGIIKGNAGLRSITPNGTQSDLLLQQTGVAAWTMYNPASSPDLRWFNGVDRLTLDSAGNLGLGGFAPQPWGSNHKAIEVAGASTGHLMAYVNSLSIGRNYYETNADIRYSFSGQAAQRLLMRDDGQFRFFTAPSGTAGAPITFTQAMTLDAAGTLTVKGIGAGNGNLIFDDPGTAYVSAQGSPTSALYLNGRQDIRFTTGGSPAGTERARITSGGNLLVGTTTDSGARITSGGTIISGTSSTNLAGVRLDSVSGQGRVGFIAADLSERASIRLLDGNGPGTMLFFTNDAAANATERARITSAGDLLVATTNNNPIGNRNNGSIIGASGGVSTRSASNFSSFGLSSTSGNHILFYTDNGTSAVLAGSIASNGATTTFNQTSDYRLKTLIAKVTDAGTRLDALNPIEYEWKSDGKRTRGFFAHEFQEVYAGSVTGTKDAVDEEGKPVYQSMQAGSSEVIADLVAEIQSLRKRLAALEQK